MDSARSVRGRIAAVVLLLAAVFAAFWPVLGAGFLNYDDGMYVADNPHVQAGFSPASLAWAWTTFEAANWHPLTWMSHMLDWRLYGAHPAGHHLSSLLLHALNAVLLFLAFERMTGATGRSACLAALFALHPLRVESVAWIAERKDVLSTFFWFLALWVYAGCAGEPRRSRLWVVAALVATGLCAKPMLVTAPLTLLLLDAWPLRRAEPLGPRVREKWALFVLAAASSAMTVVAQRAGGTVVSFGEYSVADRILNAPVFCLTYLRRAFWPADLAVFYPHPGGRLPLAQIVGATAVLALVSVCAWGLRRSQPYVLVGWLWFLTTLTPVIGIVQVGQQAVADRYTYVPLVGVFIVVVWGFPAALAALLARVGRLWGRVGAAPGDAVLAAPAVIVLVALGAGAFRQAEWWRDSETLFRRTLAVTGDNAVAHVNLGLALEEQGRLDEAALHLREAARLQPRNESALLNLGVVVGRQGRLDEAVGLLREAVRLQPGDSVALLDLGTALSKEGHWVEAGAQFTRALDIDPGLAMARANLGFVLARQGRLDEAAAQLQETIRRQPDFAEAHRQYAELLIQRGDYQGAWREVAWLRGAGLSPPAALIEQLRQKAPPAQ